MYPRRQLAELARRKSALRCRILLRRHDCARALADVLWPLAWFDRAHATWQGFSTGSKLACAASALAAARIVLRSRLRAKTILRWAPLAFGTLRGFFPEPAENGSRDGEPPPPATAVSPRRDHHTMTRIYYVDRAMCGDDLPSDFDLEEFCELLQGKLRDVEIVPVLDRESTAMNRDPALVPSSVFFEALGEYCPR